MPQKNALLLLLVLLSLYGCGVTPLEKAIKAYEYEPFNIPRSGDGVGVIVTFRNGAESLVADREQCLPAASVPGANPLIRVELEAQSYEIKDSDKIDLNLAKAISPDIDLKGAFKYTSVKKVKISFTKPFEDRVSELSVEEYAKKMSEACLNKLKNKNNYVINRVLGAEGISYSFLDENNSTVTLNADLMKQINANAAVEHQYAGQTELKIDFPVFIGYRLLQPQILPGMAITTIKFKELTSKQIQEFKPQ